MYNLRKHVKFLIIKKHHSLTWKRAEFNFELYDRNNKKSISKRADIYFCSRCNNEIFIAPNKGGTSVSIGYNKVTLNSELYMQKLSCNDMIVKQIIE